METHYLQTRLVRIAEWVSEDTGEEREVESREAARFSKKNSLKKVIYVKFILLLGVLFLDLRK